MAVRSASKYGDRKRLSIVLLCFFIAVIAVILRLIYLQIVDAKFYAHEGDKRALRVVVEEAKRGNIYDSRDEELALSTQVSTIVADPLVLDKTLRGDFQREKENCLKPSNDNLNCAWINDKSKTNSEIYYRYQKTRLMAFADAINMKVDNLIAEMKRYKNRRFLYLVKDLPPFEADRILKLKIPGISRENKYQRYYPAGELMAQIVGYTGYDGNGQEGLEKKYNELLTGIDGKTKVLKDANGNIIKITDEMAPLAPGQNLQLSIDKRIQLIMYNVLEQTYHSYQAKSVSAVMANVKTGEILGMLSLPVGNPNNNAERVPQLMKNRVVTDMFESGSTIKPIAMAAALQSGVIQMDTTFNTQGVYQIGTNTVKDTHDYGLLDATGVIRKSSNIGMSMISQQVPRDVYEKFLQDMGFGRRTAIDFVGEASGSLNHLEKMGDFSYATTFFGYGINVSALQLVSAYATIANHGKKLPLTLFKRNHPVEGVQVIRGQVADRVLSMMEQVVEEGGTGMKANTSSYTVAGKTGTAHTVTNGHYNKNRYRGLFAGVAPANNPLIALVIVVEEPTIKSYYGGTVAAPAFAKIVEGSLKALGVLPDKINKTDDFRLDVSPKNKAIH